MDSLRGRLLGFGRCGDIDLPEISGDRAVVLPGGLAILMALCKQLRIAQLHRSDFALREGVLVEMQGRAIEADISEGTVRRLMQRFDVDKAQADRVAGTALGLFDQVAQSQSWDSDLRKHLRWAALLHEVGLFMGYSGHHKHGAYLVAHGEHPGFSKQCKQVVAALILAHRGRLSKERLKARGVHHPPPLALLVLFRLAVRLHRRRSSKALPSLKLSIQGDKMCLTLPKTWLEQRPLSQADLKEEIRACRPCGVHLEVLH
jgi:exopolyphosphatase/guanosine-5'-triphosphate,3'-diphosphate pyrophosphatase